MDAAATSEGYRPLTLAARVIAVVVLGLPVLVLTEPVTVLAFVGIATVWGAVTLAGRWHLPSLLVSAAEGALVGTAAGVSLQAGPTLLAALILPPFSAGLRGGARLAILTVSAELTTVLVAHGVASGTMSAAQATDIFIWVLTGVGLGLIAGYLHAVQQQLALDPLTPYRVAQSLIRELLDLSDRLPAGLDPFALGSRIVVEVGNALPVAAAAVHISRGDQLTPLVTSAGSSSDDEARLAPVAARCWHEGTTQVSGHLFAVPLRTDSGLIAVASGMLPEATDPIGLDVDRRLEALSRALRPTAVQLDTALLFARLRDAATAGERRRLSREMHDGVAQDIVSLGYLVDALAAAPASEAQADGLRRLREQITAVVAQVRLSVQTLRTNVGASESLGAAVSGLGRHLSAASGIPIRVTVSELTTRLRPEVESELLRIAQEAMTNAVRHAEPTVIDVTCRVVAPEAEIVVRDDGKGWGQARPDSSGLAIMRERAGLIGADLRIQAAAAGGTVVTVRVPSRHVEGSPTDDADPAKVSP